MLYSVLPKSMSSKQFRFSVISLVLSITVLLGVAGCELLGNSSTGGSDLEVHKRLWKSFNSGSYSFVLQRGCFCVYAGEFEIFVFDDAIVNIIPAWDDLRGVPKEDYPYFQTIDDIFVLIEQAYASGADEIEIEYASHGYPTNVGIDYIENAVDDELWLNVSDLVMGRRWEPVPQSTQ